MALDGAFLRCLKTELDVALTDARVDKIHQPSREELIFYMRGRGGTSKLYLSARVQSPRVHITRFVPDNPATPPMFCMLLRKHLSGARLVAVRQDGLERALYLDFLSRNELGDEVTITVACELMGRNSNLILIGQDGKVLDAVRRVDFETSPTRPILPGVAYEPPPRMADKLDLWLTDPDTLTAAVRRVRETPLCEALLT
ncbi:MAG: NFACT family protein, partial [Clostridia bacterium]|nr:NFACT family protein [Clostridia bacterium]